MHDRPIAAVLAVVAAAMFLATFSAAAVLRPDTAAVAENAWLSAEAAATRLGVKPQTLYAYVSRGMVRSEPVPAS